MTVLSGREQAVRERAELARADPDFAPDLRIAEGTGARWYAEDVPWLLNLVDELTAALNCEHSRTDTDDADRLWEYVEHEGETWNRCRSCGLLELWAAGNFIKVALLAGRADTEEGGG